jgi:hypothetical protein
MAFPFDLFMTASGPLNGSGNEPDAAQSITSEGSLHSGSVYTVTFVTPGGWAS